MADTDEHERGGHHRAVGHAHGRRRRRAAVILVGATIAIYAGMLAFAGLGDALPLVGRASLPPLVGALALETATLATLAMVHRSSAAAVGHQLSYRQALNLSMSAFTLTQSVPGGGAVAGAEVVRRLRRFGLEGPYATASLALTATLTTSTIGLIGATGVAVSVWRGDLVGRVLIGAVALVVVLLAVLAAVLATVRSPRIGTRAVRALGSLSRRLEAPAKRWEDSLGHLTRRPPGTVAIARIVAWSAINWSADITALWLVFVAFDQSVTLAVVLVGFAASQLGAAIPLTPGGTGFVEGGMVTGFVALGVPFTIASVVVIVYRVVATWLPALAGLAMLLRPPVPQR